MIDTVEFRIHDIKLHLGLANFLDRKQSGTGKSITMRSGSDDDFTPQQKLVHKTYIQYHDTGNLHQVAQFNELKSSHYSIAYKIDYLRDFIAFNVSIPKYVYGVNILHYNRSPLDKRFSALNHASIKRNLTESYKRLFHFFDKFFVSEFGSIEIYPQFVEVNRVDICYNQVFDSKSDAFEYLNQLRKLKKKYARNASNYSRDWKTSIVYKTDRYSFKVYHKGTEFAKNDARHLRELNESGAARFDVDYYQSFADRILRYEMTFRNSQISHLFMHHLFRRDCHLWQAGLKLWNKAKQKKADATKWFEFRAGLEPQERRLIDYVNLHINKTKKFYLAGDAKMSAWDEETDHSAFLAFPGKQERFGYGSVFSPELWSLLCDRFVSLLAEFKIDLFEDANGVLRKVEAYNEKVEADRAKLLRLGFDKKSDTYLEIPPKISVQKMKVLLTMLETQTFEEIEESKVFDRQTWWRHRKALALVGVTQTSLLSCTTRADMDLRSYNTELLFNSSKFVNLSF